MEVEVKVCGPIDYSSFRPWYFAPGTLKAAVIIRSKPYATVLHINTYTLMNYYLSPVLSGLTETF